MRNALLAAACSVVLPACAVEQSPHQAGAPIALADFSDIGRAARPGRVEATDDDGGTKGATGFSRSEGEPVGGPCTFDAHCADELSCYVADLPAAGVGVCRIRGGANVACAADSDCVDTLRCVSYSCVARVPLGARCFSDRDCAEGLLCESYHCERKAHAGEPHL
jgi:hypothetical protein